MRIKAMVALAVLLLLGVRGVRAGMTSNHFHAGVHCREGIVCNAACAGMGGHLSCQGGYTMGNPINYCTHAEEGGW